MLSILLVSQVRLFHEGLRALLARQDVARVVGTATEDVQAIRLVREMRPDVIVLDQAYPGALPLTRRLSRHGSTSRVVALGIPDTDERVPAFAEAGVAGYVPRDASVEDLVATIEGAVRGELHCTPQLAGAIARRLAWRATAAPEAPLPRLTARETEVVDLITKGYSNKEIAGTLGIEVATVKNHVHNLLEKLNLRRRAQVAARVGARGGHLTRSSGPFRTPA